MTNHPSIAPAPEIDDAKIWRIPFHRPLRTVSAVVCDLDKTAAQVQELIEDGSLIAFNIAVDLTSRACVRILARSEVYYFETRGKKLELNWPELFETVCPARLPNILASSIQRCLSCDRGHVENLINANAFKTVSKSHPGPGGSAVLIRASFEAWLKGRLV